MFAQRRIIVSTVRQRAAARMNAPSKKTSDMCPTTTPYGADPPASRRSNPFAFENGKDSVDGRNRDRFLCPAGPLDFYFVDLRR